MTSNSDSEYKKWEEIMQNIEDRVIEELEKKAKSEGWIPIKNVGRGKPGVDLKLTKDNRIIIIEAKGERLGPPQHGSEVRGALGEIIMDMKGESPAKVYCYCMAFPDTKGFRRVVHDISAIPRQRLGLNIIFVECPEGSLKLLQPGAPNATNLSNLDELFHIG